MRVENNTTVYQSKTAELDKQSNLMKIVSSINSLTQQNKLVSFNQNVVGNFYNENRLSSMSHIKQINPKYKNYIIPVLPGLLNKFT